MTHYSKKTNSTARMSWTPVLMAIILTFGVLLGMNLGDQTSQITVIKQDMGDDGLVVGKVDELIRYIDAKYVDALERDTLVDIAINNVISNLDPHSSYINSRALTKIESRLKGSYEGVGIKFVLLQDTVYITEVMEDGPAASAQLTVGDRILNINDQQISGQSLTMEEVEDRVGLETMDQLTIDLLSKDNQVKTVQLDRAPIAMPSVDEGVMIDEITGYIKINHFANKTYVEFMSELERLSNKGLKHLVLDLRQNPGGYLSQATRILDQLFNREGVLLVYTEGRSSKKMEYKTSGRNLFDVDEVAVLIDGGSASASEIIAGAIQDNDRGLIIGERSFGKGLVQEQYDLSDGSALRLTVANYYTPSGRSIQKPYKKPQANLEEVKDSILYYTANGRPVEGQGGIEPDLSIEGLSNPKLNDFGQSLVHLFIGLHYDSLNESYPLPSAFDLTIESLPNAWLVAYESFFKQFEQEELFESKSNDFQQTLITQLGEKLLGSKDFLAFKLQQDPAIQKSQKLLLDEQELNTILGY